MSAPAGATAFAVGMALAGHPPHRSRRAELPHRAPALGSDVLSRSLRPHVFGRARVAGLPGLESRTWFALPNFPWPNPFPPGTPPNEVSPAPCSRPSQVLWACQISRRRSSWLYFLFDHADLGVRPRPTTGPPGETAMTRGPVRFATPFTARDFHPQLPAGLSRRFGQLHQVVLLDKGTGPVWGWHLAGCTAGVGTR